MNFEKTVLCIGAGYVGGPTMAVIASKCPEVKVIVADINAKRIADWQSDNLPIYEPGLDEVVKTALPQPLFHDGCLFRDYGSGYYLCQRQYADEDLRHWCGQGLRSPVLGKNGATDPRVLA